MKICPNCQAQFPDDTKFCATCGANISEVAPVQETPVQAPVQEAAATEAPAQTTPPAQDVQSEAPASAPAPEAKKTPVKMIAIIAAVAVIFFIIVLSMASAFSGGSDFIEVKNSYSVFTNSDGDSVIVFNGKDVVTLDDGASDYYSNVDRTGAFLISDGDLKFVTKDGETDIDSDVINYTPSIDRETIVYTKEADEDEGTVELYVWDGKESTMIDTDVFPEIISISPNGKNITYIKDMDDEGEDFDTYLSKNGKAGELVDDLDGRAVFSISDDGKTTVVYDVEKDDFYAIKGKKETKLASEGDLTSIYFNEDHSEILFVADSKLYISKNAGDREKIANDISSVSICVPENKTLQSAYSSKLDESFSTYAIDSFIGQTLFVNDTDGEYNIITFNKELEITTLAKDVTDYTLTENEKTLFYVKNNDIYKMKAGKSDSAEKIASDVMSYVISPDGKDVYYTNDDEELCYINGKKIEIVGEDASNLRLAENGYLYYIEDIDTDTYVGDLYCVKGKGKSEAVENGEDTYSVRTAAGEILFVSDFDSEDRSGTLYRADGKKSVQIAEEIYG